MKLFAVGCWILSATGFVLAFTGVAPDAINMGVGAGIPAVIITAALVWPV